MNEASAYEVPVHISSDCGLVTSILPVRAFTPLTAPMRPSHTESTFALKMVDTAVDT